MSINKSSNLFISEDDEEEGIIFFKNKNISCDTEGAQNMNSTVLNEEKFLKRKGPLESQCERQRKLLKRLGHVNTHAFERAIDVHNTSYRTKLRHVKFNTANRKEEMCPNGAAGSAIETSTYRHRNNVAVSTRSNQARASCNTSFKHNEPITGGVTTRKKSALTASVQLPFEIKREIQPNQHIGSQQLHDFSIHRDEEEEVEKARSLIPSSSANRAEEAGSKPCCMETQQLNYSTEDRTTNLQDAQKSSVSCDRLNHTGKMITVYAFDDPRRLGSDRRYLSPDRSRIPEQCFLNNQEAQKNSSVVRLQSEDVALQDALALEPTVMAGKLLGPPRMPETDTKLKNDTIKLDPGTKICLIATNSTETGGRQMRPRPLDLEHPLLILVEGLDKDYYGLDGGSLYQTLKQQAELKNPCVSQLEPNCNKDILHAMKVSGGKDDSIVIPSVRTCVEYNESIHRCSVQYKLPDAYIRGEPIGEQFQAEYDADEEDEDWLSKYNVAVPPSSALSVEQFERAIDILENQAAEQSFISSGACYYQEDKEQALQECCICNGKESSHNNRAFKCVSCHILVHQYCYGIGKGWRKRRKKQYWRCEKCEAVWEGMVRADISCSLCYKQGGALKPSTEAQKWAHIVCALYISETHFVNPDAMESIVGVNEAEARARQQKRQCWLCGTKEGCVEKCSLSMCKAQFHVSCGVIQGASFELKHFNNQQGYVNVYCPRHTAKGVDAITGLCEEYSETGDPSCCEDRSNKLQGRKQCEKKGSNRGKDHLNGRNVENKQCQLGVSVRKDSGDGSNLVWRLDRQLLDDTTENREIEFKEDCKVEPCQTSSKLIAGIYSYWVSKRAQHGGPLLHHILQEETAKRFGIFNPDDGGFVTGSESNKSF
ncbi:hypothetical protein KP509_27G069700 [Ceratopteris richardii]|nr:hypothetical protein KP509_27G069700 [Ceratopteris richardii]